VWEAVYILDGLLNNDSDIQPDTVHADTQGQSLPVYGLATLLGFDLLPRIRNWHDLIFFRPTAATRYRHIDSLFGPQAINWRLLETHWPDLLRTAISVREGRISSVTLLSRLRHDSRKNRLYQVLRELGRVVRTRVLLRFLSEPALRETIITITNRVESFHNFATWFGFGAEEGVLATNDPIYQAIAARTAPRDRVLALLPLYAGLRVSETVALDTDDVRLSARKGTLRVRGKGGKPRDLPVHAQLRTDLQAWLDERPDWPGAGTSPALLLNRRGGRLSVRGASDIICGIAAEANLDDEHITAHTGRHTFATTLIRGGTDLVTVADMLGHARLDTVRLYTRPTAADRERALNLLPYDR